MERTWIRDEFYDKLTGQLVGIEVSPRDDLRQHESCPNCSCIPIYRDRDGVQYLIHNAFDGREVDERKERGH